MKYSVIVLSYGRVRHLENALACLLAQDYPDDFEILIFNSCVQQTLVFDNPLVKIINAKERPKTLGACRNAAIEAATGTHLIILDDDDACLSNFVSTFAKGFADGSQWIHHSSQFYAVGDTIKDIVRGTFNTVAFTRDAWLKSGKYAEQTVGEDRSLVGRITATCNGRILDIPEREVSAIYCWGHGDVYHVSGMGADTPRNNSYARAEADLMRRLRNKSEPSGTIILNPRMRCDWPTLTRSYLEKHGWLREKINGVGVIQGGRFGDIINTLPIVKKLHDDGENPHLIVSREFAPILDGVSYVTPCIQDYPWVEIDRATRVAQSQFTKVLRLQLYGKGHVQERRTASFNMEQWREAGLLGDFHNPEMRPVFDKRDAQREALVLAKLFRTNKPKIVTNLTKAASSPFRNGPMLLSVIRNAFKATHEVVEVGNLKLHRIYDLLGVIEQAALLISVDTATLHLAAATTTPVIALVNDAPWLGSVVRYNDVGTLCYRDATKDAVLSLIRDFLFTKSEAGREVAPLVNHSAAQVSAVISVYKPNIAQLNRCLSCILPQVGEVIICGDLDTPWPIDGLLFDPKVKCVRMEATHTGYGKKATHGAMHASGKFLHFLNDDVYLNPDTIQTCLAQMAGNVAVVTHLLRHLDGTIQYAGKFRMRGMHGFAHTDHLKLVSRHKQPVEQESACGASMLVRRDAFMEVGCYDEAYFLYSEDDDLVMKLRQAGYRVMFTPHTEGIHEEHSSMAKTEGWMKILHQSNDIFARRWGWYFKHNPNPNVIGKFKSSFANAVKRTNAGKETAVVIRRKIAAGDVLLTTPIIAALKKQNPSRKIFVETDYPEILRDNPDVARAGKVIKLPTNYASMIDLTMAYENRPNMNYLSAYANAAGVTLQDCRPRIYPNDMERKFVEQKLGLENRWCVINAGNPCGNRVWPMESYTPVIQHLRNIGFKVAQVGKFSGMKGCDLDFTGKTTIHQLAALIEYCALFIGIDSLPLHIACATGTTSIGLFGVTLPERVLSVSHNVWPVVSDPNHPWSGARHRVVTDDSIVCDSNPMETITPEHVIEKIDEVVYRLNGLHERPGDIGYDPTPYKVTHIL